MGQKSQSNQGCQRAGLHLFHYFGPADLDRADTHVQLIGDLAVRLALDQEFEHVAQRGRELIQATVDRLHVGKVLTVGGIPTEGLIDRGPQALLAAGFQHEVACPSFHRQHGRIHVGFRGDADHRPMIFASAQRVKAFQFDIRVGHVEQDAAGVAGRGNTLEVIQRVA